MNEQQRLEVYQQLKELLQQSNKPRSFCSLLMWHIPGIPNLYTDLPELLEQRDPYHMGAFWFDLTPEGTQQRIQLLDNAISKLKVHDNTTSS